MVCKKTKKLRSAGNFFKKQIKTRCARMKWNETQTQLNCNFFSHWKFKESQREQKPGESRAATQQAESRNAILQNELYLGRQWHPATEENPRFATKEEETLKPDNNDKNM